MDTLMRQASGIRKKTDDPTYIEFVAKNMERIAEEYAELYQKFMVSNELLIEIQEKIEIRFKNM